MLEEARFLRRPQPTTHDLHHFSAAFSHRYYNLILFSTNNTTSNCLIMDYGGDTGFSSGNVAQALSGSFLDQEVWATEDEYRVWSGESSMDTNANYDVKTSQSQFGSDTKPRNSIPDDMSTPSTRSKSIGKMFHKTKLCCKFRSGTCPYITNCNFAHGLEELRKPPPNWQDIVAAHEEERVGLASMDPKEEYQIPSVAEVESQRSYKGRQCKKFYSGEGCPYGDNCTYLHDEQSKARESDAISLCPSTGGGGGGGYYSNSNNSPGLALLKPSNWKTKMCNKWELTGYCPFGIKCHFAHGIEVCSCHCWGWTELHGYGGTLIETEAKGSSAPVETMLTAGVSAEAFGGGVTPIPSSERASNNLMIGQRPNLKRKGRDKISKVYGDWIDDL